MLRPTVIKATPSNNYILFLEFDNGEEKQFDVTAKEEAVADTLAVALEMHARGFKFKNPTYGLE